MRARAAGRRLATGMALSALGWANATFAGGVYDINTASIYPATVSGLHYPAHGASPQVTMGGDVVLTWRGWEVGFGTHSANAIRSVDNAGARISIGPLICSKGEDYRSCSLLILLGDSPDCMFTDQDGGPLDDLESVDCPDAVVVQ
ncbi:MAG: hypothetical protein P4M09_11190 [Devosia sp.]|nr:hypothetical protein [Devosia sp.]